MKYRVGDCVVIRESIRHDQIFAGQFGIVCSCKNEKYCVLAFNQHTIHMQCVWYTEQELYNYGTTIQQIVKEYDYWMRVLFGWDCGIRTTNMKYVGLGQDLVNPIIKELIEDTGIPLKVEKIDNLKILSQLGKEISNEPNN